LHNDKLCSLYPSPKYYYDQLKEREIGWQRGEKIIQNVDKKTEGENLGISRRIILKWNLQEIGSEDADRIHQAQDRDHWQAAVNIVKNAGFSKWCTIC